jgi:Flp pilus assembly protein TadG
MIRPKLKSFTSKFLRAESGIAAIEAAFILPFMLLLYFGLIDLTAAIGFSRKITATANAVADLTAQNRTSVIKSDISDYYNAATMIMSPTPIANVSINVYGYRMVGSTPTQTWKTSNGSGPGCTAIPQSSAMTPLMSAGNDLIVAIACYNYTPYVATFLGHKILGTTSMKIEQTIMVRPRTTAKLDCYTSVALTTLCT